MRLIRTFLVFFIVLFCKSLFAQPEYYKFAHLDINGGLSHNQVRCFLKDQKGFLWIGTEVGLNRFDGYTVRKYFNDSQDSTSIRNNSIQSLFELPEGQMGVLTVDGLSIYDPMHDSFLNGSTSYLKIIQIHPDSIREVIKHTNDIFWFIPKSHGIILYDEKSKTSTSFKNNPTDTTTIVSSAVTCITQINTKSYWIAHDDGTIEHAELSDKNLKVTYRNYLLKKDRRFALNIKIVADNDDDLWIHLLNDNRGIYFFDSKLKTTRHIYKESPGMHLNANIVASVTVGNDGLIWVATDHGGINLINKKSGQTMIISHHDEDPRSLAQNSITTLYNDNEGIIWIGTYKHGLNYYHKNIIRFPLYQHYPLDLKGLPFGDVNRFVEDKKGNLWIGTNGGGLIYFDREKNTFKQFKNNPNDPSSLSSDVIVSLLIDENDILWIGTFYGGLNSFDGRKFKRFMPVLKDPSSISSRSVWEIFEDSRHRLWIGTLDGGLELMDRKTNTFTHYRSGDINSVRSTYISTIIEDKNGNLWFGTRGIDILMRETGRFVHYENEKKNPKSLSSNTILDIKEASDGKIWIATLTGLNLFDAKTKTFSLYREADGLPSNSVLTILEDNQKNLWLGTANGLSKMTLNKKDGQNKYVFQNFDEADGLQGKQFNENASLKTRNDELIFGGSNGFNIFRPELLGVNKNPPQIVLTDFQLFTKSVKPGERIDGRIILSKSIVHCDEVVLPANENVFSIEFAALNFFHPEKNDYKYNLEGFSTDWLTADSKSRKITFTNLNPGNYIFHVKAANNDGIWNDKGASLKITVLPPFWKTDTAFVAYVLFIVGALLLTRKLIQQREQMKFVIRQERQEALRMHELDMMKIKFFTNVSHEFRTPLTLILTPLEKLLKQVSDQNQQSQFLLIQRNAKRLLNLVNQLLDFRKMEVQELKFNPSEGDIIAFLKETVSSFSDLSEKKHIQLHFESSVPILETLFDQDKLEKILFNLLSNAFKFTPDHGAVSVNVTLLDGNNEEKCLRIMVRDTGIGITPEKQERIFERFFQNELPKSMVNQGSGIGLSITKEFVRIMNGTITVESELEKGSVFIIELPVKEVFITASTSEVEQAILAEPSKANIDNERVTTPDDKKPILLLVEDNEDFRFYLKDNLRDTYHVIEAKDGLDGWHKIIEYLPDLMVSDIMMPNMNGIELTRKVRSDKRVSHIPIILLTARTAEEQKLEGFEAGTDEYLTKPFNFEILISRIRNLILQREKFQKSFSKQLDVKASELNITSVDEKFIKDAIHCVEEHIESTEFSVEDLSRELAISRAHLYKKIHALTGKSPLEFMRVIRLQQAAQLLERSQLTVAEIAYKVGFNNPKYFARYFKDEFGMLPSMYAASKRERKS
ncbi:MAG TPA: two-component regulator propeller domain-containing protein [Cyclobacteriaceae bacterium]|nr:two-component regulator propeller domain-containing protein [Cyclobacteriaceae bacterium]